MNEAEPLDEETIIKILWGGFGTISRDPFNDDAAWLTNQGGKKYLVGKADMFVATTDAPPQMSPQQIAEKSIVACVSDLAAKGVSPKYCLISLGLPKTLATTSFVTSLARGFAQAEADYKLRIIGGDTNATSLDLVIDCSLFGFSNSLVLRRGGKPGDLIGVSGKFGAQPAGLLILLEKATSNKTAFEKSAIASVLDPRARLDIGVKASRFLTSCIDSSDGLAISLYHLAESSRRDFSLNRLPVAPGVEQFASENGLNYQDLVLFGGEEYELVCTYPMKYEARLSKLGIETIGIVTEKRSEKPEVRLEGQSVPRKGWVHFKSKD
ncbi:MAG TPA: thiamine-phosphate kinase [Nitrososphaerales archaeon]|nr:thiamine-phosphate kinase [Nitrososphaerales archaeon]